MDSITGELIPTLSKTMQKRISLNQSKKHYRFEGTEVNLWRHFISPGSRIKNIVFSSLCRMAGLAVFWKDSEIFPQSSN